jgi:hypothetical protein
MFKKDRDLAERTKTLLKNKETRRLKAGKQGGKGQGAKGERYHRIE